MACPRSPFISDNDYTTPLPQQPCEAALWRAVARLYQYTSLQALLEVNRPATEFSPSYLAFAISKPASAAEVSPTGRRAGGGSVDVPRGGVLSTCSLTAAAAGGKGVGGCRASLVEANTELPQSSTSSPIAASTTASSVTSLVTSVTNPSVLLQAPLTHVPAETWSLSPCCSTGSSSGKGLSSGSCASTSYIRATCRRVLQPVQTLLTQFYTDGICVGASVVDLAVQHPLPHLRTELVQLLLTFSRWNWSMCAPVAVAAGVGDMDVLKSLLSVEDLEPNLGFPLTVAVRCHQNEKVLPFLVSHQRIRPNYGGAFFVAVAIGNNEAMHILGAAAGVNINRFANSEGTSALLYALRQYLRLTVVETVAQQPAFTTYLVSPLGQNPQSGGLTAPARDAFFTVLPPDAGRSSLVSLEAAVPTGGITSAPVSSKAMLPPGHRCGSVIGNRSPIGAMSDGYMACAGAMCGVDQVEACNSVNQHDTTTDRLQRAEHWHDVLMYLLNHPAIEVNAGYYLTPLQMAVFAGNSEVVAWLLQHPHLHPNRIPKPASVLCNSYYVLQRQTFSQNALRCIVATPVEIAMEMRQIELFTQLVRDQRVRLPASLTMGLERLAWNSEAIPYLTVIARYRAAWEGWGWRWRRHCAFIATSSNCIVVLCSWTVCCVWYSSLRACGVVFLWTYALQVVMSVVLFAQEARTARVGTIAADQSTTRPAPVLLALVQHLVPSLSRAWRVFVLAVLLLCPAMVPLLDLLCAWSLYKAQQSRRLLQTASYAGSRVPAAFRPHRSIGPPEGFTTSSVGATARGQLDRTPTQLKSPSLTASFAGNGSMDEHSLLSVTLNDSFSRPRPAVARTRRQRVGGCGSIQRRSNTVGDARASTVAGCAVSASVHPATTSAAVYAASPNEKFVSRTESSAVTKKTADLSGGRRAPWVLPNRPSRFTALEEYHPPDLTLRALAYVTYDRLLVAPRLVLSAVGILIFTQMIFPSFSTVSSAATAMVESRSLAAVEEAMPPLFAVKLNTSVTASNFAFTRYSDDAPLSAVLTREAANGIDVARTDAPQPTSAMSLVGLFGLLASIVSGTALLAMATSLRTIVSQSWFASPNKRDGDGGDHGFNDRVLHHSEWDQRHLAAATRADHIL